MNLVFRADEPTGNLDDYSTSLVLELFLAVNQLGKSVVIVTHRMPNNLSVRYRRFHIDEGRLSELA
ncbi:hypothetical protein AGMMS50229_12610 [Campylobacterota bacterium]|nr:hypothetical protein AGMMS50229_12610 [Campylobacterota bacterium]